MAWVTQFMDGFDHYATADIGAKWSYSNGSNSMDSSIFRNSGQSIRLTSSGSIVSKQAPQARNWVVGFGYYCTTGLPAALTGDGSSVLSFGNGIESTILGQVTLGHIADGKLHVCRSDCTPFQLSGTPVDLGASTTTLAAATWYYIELRVFIDDSAGQVELRVNGVTEVNLTGVDTKFQSSIDYASVLALFGGGNSGISRRYDDFYMRTSSSSTAETGGFLGDVKVKPYFPNADGTYTAMTCSTGTTHNTLVDENPPNTTDYVSSSTALTKDSYGFQDASETGSIKAVQVSAYAYKADAGFRGAEVFCKSSSTESFGTSQPLSTTPKYVIKMFERDPNTSADWSQANFNAAEFGVRISADV